MKYFRRKLGNPALIVFGISISACSSSPIQSGELTKQRPMTEQEYYASLPDDVFPDSRSRLPIVNRDDLDDKGKAIYDRYMSPDSTSLAGIQGPGGMRLHKSVAASPTKIDGKTRELIRLVISREMDHVFEWTMHEPVALKEGLDPEIIDVIRLRKSLANVPEKEAVIIQLGREIFQQHQVTSDTYARAQQQFGTSDLIAVTELMGRGVTSFILLYMFDLHLPYGREPLLPVP